MENDRKAVILACVALLLMFTGFSKGIFPSACDRATFDIGVNALCVPLFNKSMEYSGYQHTCPWPTERIPYYNLSRCVDLVAKHTRCVEPSMKNELFLGIHQTYFTLCSPIKEPSLGVVLLFVMPCVLTTLLLPFLCAHLNNSNVSTPAGLRSLARSRIPK